MKVQVAALVLVTTLLSGCASWLAGGPSRVEVAVRPVEGTMLDLKNATTGRIETLSGATQSLVLDKQSDYWLTVRKPGYATQDIHVGRELQPAYYGNMALGLGVPALCLAMAATQPTYSTLSAAWWMAAFVFVGLPAAAAGGVGLWLDSSTGNKWHHVPEHVDVELQPAPGAP